jgi:hypothetical protein
MKLWVMLIGLWASLRLWLVLSFWTVVCSSLLTYFLLKQGGQIDEPNTLEDPPAIEWVSATQGSETAQFQRQDSTLVVAGTRTSVVGVKNSVTMKLRNDGKGPLKIAVISASCSCGEVMLDGKKMEPVGEVEPTPAQLTEVKSGAEAELTVSWTPEIKHMTGPGNFRLTVTLNVNDPHYAGRVRMEIMTQLKASNDK